EIDKDFRIRGLLTVADVPTEFSVEVVERHWEKMEPQFFIMANALKSTIDFARSPDGRILAAKLLPLNALLPLVYFLSKIPNASVPDNQRKPLRALLYFLVFNDFLSGRSPHARVRYLREVLQKHPGPVVPLDALLAEVARRQKHTSLTTSAELLHRNPALALN